ncbi:MAG: flavodoxin family protein [Clostridia bacterium]|nr:flavodoxin family protein [Clostridia bacterium]
MKRILILNGAGRRNGSTAEMTRAFAEAARANGNEVEEFFLQYMDIRGCVNCGTCGRNVRTADSPCSRKDDMDLIYPAFGAADVVVFASPVYFWDITGPLKTAVDRLYAPLRRSGIADSKKEFALLMTSGGSTIEHMLDWCSSFENRLGWTRIGAAMNDVEEARRIGAGIK